MAQSRPVSPIITKMLAILTPYLEHRNELRKAQEQGETLPTQPMGLDMRKGMLIHNTLTTAMQEHGDEDEQNDLVNFERNPNRYEEFMGYVISDMAARHPVLAHTLEEFAHEQGIAEGQIPTGRQLPRDGS